MRLEGVDRRSWIALAAAGGFGLASPYLAKWLESTWNTPSKLPSPDQLLRLQRELTAIGYLAPGFETSEFDCVTARALVRFKRHARRTYRVCTSDESPDDIGHDECFAGDASLDVDESTFTELARWRTRNWRLPLGRFKITYISPDGVNPAAGLRWARLREDVASRWWRMREQIQLEGGTLEGPYGDTWRPLGYHYKEGTSPRSFHISGRAVDLNQRLVEGRRPRYWVVPEGHRGRIFWRILCRTTLQDGSQGKYIRERQQIYWQYLGNRLLPLPPGYYLDLTERLAQEGFERIPARHGWQKNYLNSEWWHYQLAGGKQETFLDEVELVGIGEKQLAKAGYSVAEMDLPPG